MKGILILTLVCLAVSETFAADTLTCYQCSNVLQECEVDKAVEVKCGVVSKAKCSKQIKKGSTDEEKAIRKCVVPPTNGQIPCPDGYTCHNCDSNLCNSGSPLKFAWGSLIGVLFTLFYMY